VFALPFALVAAFLAGRHLEPGAWPGWGRLGLILLCMVAGRSVAMTFNRIVDTEIDSRNPRTATRPLPTGSLTRWAAYVMLIASVFTFGVGCLGFFYFFDNTWPILLSGPALVYLCAYSFTNRFTRWSHFILGSAISMSPAAAWIAVHPASLGSSALLLMLAVTCWIAGFDIIYALQDEEFDKSLHLNSIPVVSVPATKRSKQIATMLISIKN
jgi:4-hydroxybenzoate polyprenyltransferase